MATKTSRFAINIDDGRVVYRTTATDALDVLYKKIDDETADAIIKGKIPAMVVVNAIMSHEYHLGTFNWKEYEKKRKLLNMRQADVEIEDQDEEPEEKLKEDKPGEVMTLDQIRASGATAVPGAVAAPAPAVPAPAPAAPAVPAAAPAPAVPAPAPAVPAAAPAPAPAAPAPAPAASGAAGFGAQAPAPAQEDANGKRTVRRGGVVDVDDNGDAVDDN